MAIVVLTPNRLQQLRAKFARGKRTEILQPLARRDTGIDQQIREMFVMEQFRVGFSAGAVATLGERVPQGGFKRLDDASVFRLRLEEDVFSLPSACDGNDRLS